MMWILLWTYEKREVQLKLRYPAREDRLDKKNIISGTLLREIASYLRRHHKKLGPYLNNKLPLNEIILC